MRHVLLQPGELNLLRFIELAGDSFLTDEEGTADELVGHLCDYGYLYDSSGQWRITPLGRYTLRLTTDIVDGLAVEVLAAD